MKNVALVGIGPHAKRIYLNYFKKHKVNLALVIDLNSQRESIKNYLVENGFKNTKIFTIDDIYKDDEQKKILVSNIKSKILELKELLNERRSHRQHIPNVGKQMFKQQLALVETLEKWIIDFENSLKEQN